MLVELSSFIESDLEAIADYIAQDNPMRAVSFIREIREELRLVGQNPLLYQLRPEIGEDARLAVVGRYASAQLSQSQVIVHRDLDILFGAKITLGGLDRRVPQQEFDLLEISSTLPAELGAGTAQVVGAEVLDANLLR